MSRLVDESVVLNNIHNAREWNEVLAWLEIAPTVDAVEVIRCENCKHYKKSEVSDRMMCWRKDVDGQPVCYDFNPDDFCSYGERRADECHQKM